MHFQVYEGPYFSCLKLSLKNFKKRVQFFITEEKRVVLGNTYATRSDWALWEEKELLEYLEGKAFFMVGFLLKDGSDALCCNKWWWRGLMMRRGEWRVWFDGAEGVEGGDLFFFFGDLQGGLPVHSIIISWVRRSSDWREWYIISSNNKIRIKIIDGEVRSQSQPTTN